MMKSVSARTVPVRTEAEMVRGHAMHARDSGQAHNRHGIVRNRTRGRVCTPPPGVSGSESMKPWELLGETSAPDGSRILLVRRDTEYVIRVDGKILMSSRMHGSEEALATAGCQHLRQAEAPRV